MSEPTTNPAGTQATNPTDATADTVAASYRVSGHLPLTVSVTAGSADEATTAAPAAIAAVFADLAGATLTPDLYAINGPELVEQPAGQPGRHRVEVTTYGHLDVTADDPAAAVVVAEETLLDHLAGRSDVTIDWTFAVCDDVTPLDGSTSAE